MSRKTIDDLRTVLFETIDALKSGAMDIDKAKVISDLSQVMVNTAKVEIEFVKITDSKGSGFIPENEPKELPPGIAGVHVHKIA